MRKLLINPSVLGKEEVMTYLKIFVEPRLEIVVLELKGTVARDFVANFFIPIHRPDLGDGPLTGIHFGRCACAEKRAFYALSHMLKRGTNAQFRVRNCSPLGCNFTPTVRAALPVGVTLHPGREHALPVALAMLRAALTVGVTLHPGREHALPVALAMLRAALTVGVKI